MMKCFFGRGVKLTHLGWLHVGNVKLWTRFAFVILNIFFSELSIFCSGYQKQRSGKRRIHLRQTFG
jgi:hypothetical protein